MGLYLTLSERKAAQRAAIAQAVMELRAVLADCARANGGRFLLYGSAARGDLNYDSAVNLLLDFPEDRQATAWRFAEQACWDRGVEPDIRPLAWCSHFFLNRVLTDAIVLA
jgi:hypothetical protein